MSGLDLVPRVLSISPPIHWIFSLYSFLMNWYIYSSISSLYSVIDTLRAAQTPSAHFFVVYEFVKENTSLQLVLSANCFCFLSVKKETLGKEKVLENKLLDSIRKKTLNHSI